MMQVYAIASNIVTSLGISSQVHWQAINRAQTGIKEYNDLSLSSMPFYASRLDPTQWQYIQAAIRSPVVLYPFEELALFSAMQALQDQDISLKDTIFILSTTKGNIELLGKVSGERLLLHKSAAIIAAQLGISNRPAVVSQACISGSLALMYGLRLLQAGHYKHALVTGCDRFTKFVLSGFQSFQAIADKPCKPFDAERNGITLGEGAGSILLSVYENDAIAALVSGAVTNDANHISGPSRTGHELSLAVDKAMHAAGIVPADIDMISAHGTATLYNDEMETKAFGLSHVQHSPVHSFKSYIGHTLGAAGVIESAVALESIKYQQLVPSLGYSTSGVSQPLNITRENSAANIRHVLKTASGFGGSNAALIWKRVDG